MLSRSFVVTRGIADACAFICARRSADEATCCKFPVRGFGCDRRLLGINPANTLAPASALPLRRISRRVVCLERNFVSTQPRLRISEFGREHFTTASRRHLSQPARPACHKVLLVTESGLAKISLQSDFW